MRDMAVSALNGDDHENERPAKKRRFFVEDENGASNGHDAQNVSQQDISSQADFPVNDKGNDTIDERQQQSNESTTVQQNHPDANGFDAQLFTSIVGQDVPETTIAKIRKAAGGNLERAINMFLDGSFERMTTRPRTASIPDRPQRTLPVPLEAQPDTVSQNENTSDQTNVSEWTPPEGAEVLQHMPSHR